MIIHRLASLTLPLALPILLAACAADDNPGERSEYPAELRAEIDLDDYQPCDVETPCPAGLDCVALDLAGGTTEPLCIPTADACELIDCGSGDCLVLESYPAQIRCACEGDACAPGDDADDPVSDDQ